MRVFVTTTVDGTKRIWRHGFYDNYEEFGMRGVYCSNAVLDINNGWAGSVVLCIEVSQEAFECYEVNDPYHDYREAIVPCEVLNRFGKPQVYDHEFAGSSRRELLQAEASWERSEDTRFLADEMREARQFFDEIGWLSPLSLTE